MDIQKVAEEYEKLIGSRYVIGIENGETIDFSFSASDFYHLLGFSKFQGASIVTMVDDKAYSKAEFFKAVLDGNITYSKTNIHVKNMDKYYVNGKWKELCEVKDNDKLLLVKNNRIPYFSYSNMMHLIESEIVALFDKAQANDWLRIEADKIFFKYMHGEMKNLNFFVRKKELSKGDCPVSFFLEAKKDEYLRTKRGSSESMQKQVKVTYRAFYDNGTELQTFCIFWDKIRFYYSKSCLQELYKSQKRLQEYFETGTVVSSTDVQQFIKDKSETLKKISQAVDAAETKYRFKQKIKAYNSAKDTDEKEILAIEIIEESGIDIENNPEIVEESDLKILEHSIQKLKTQISTSKKQIKKCQKFLPALETLERKEIIYAYSTFIQEIESYEDEFITMLILEKK